MLLKVHAQSGGEHPQRNIWPSDFPRLLHLQIDLNITHLIPKLTQTHSIHGKYKYETHLSKHNITGRFLRIAKRLQRQKQRERCGLKS